MFKKAFQQGRSERRGEAYVGRYVRASERCQNEAGGLFQHSVRSALLTGSPVAGIMPDEIQSLLLFPQVPA